MLLKSEMKVKTSKLSYIDQEKTCNKIRNESGDVTIGLTETERILREYNWRTIVCQQIN